MHNTTRDKSSSQQRKSSSHEQKHNSTKNIKEEHMTKSKDSAMYANNQMNKSAYNQQYNDSVSNKSVVQSQKHQQKSHHDKNHTNLQNNLSPSTHMVPNQNTLNAIAAQSNNLLNANAAINANMMQAATKNSALSGVNEQQHHIQNTHHQDLTGNTTPNSNTTELKQHTSPTTDLPSMGVYTPDSTTNSVHSLHHYGQCDLDVAQLGLESPASIASDIASQNSVENVRPPSVASHSQMNQFADCSLQQQHQQQANQAHLHMAIQQHHQQQQANASRGYQLTPNEIPIGMNNHQQNAQAQQQNSSRKMAQQQHMQVAAQQQVRATNNRSSTPKARNTSTPSLQQQQQHSTQRAQRTATPNTVQQQMVSPNQQIQHLNMQQQHLQHQQAQSQHQSQQVHQQNLDVQQIDQYNNHLAGASVHGHHQMHQDYLGVPQMAASQNYASQSPNSYGSLPMTSVIQHRMSGNHSMTTHNPLPSPHQRLGPSPSSCSVGSNYYTQNTNVPHPVSHTPVPQTRTPSATPTLQQQMNANVSGTNDVSATGNNANLTGQTISGNVSSLSKLQQLTNGLEIAPCNTPPASLNLTPSPNHHPHNTMTPPPSHLVNQNRNLPTPPAQMPSIPYHYKYHSSNIPQHIPIAQNTSRTARNTASAPVQHMGGGSPSSRASPNVALSSNLISPYSSALNGYRMTAQQSSGYIGNSAAGFINNPSQLQMANMANVMNMPTQYQDQHALQRAAAVQQYPAYPYIPLNTNSMRR